MKEKILRDLKDGVSLKVWNLEMQQVYNYTWKRKKQRRKEMKLKEYQTYDNFKTITFESDAGYQVEFTIVNGGDITVEAQCNTCWNLKSVLRLSRVASWRLHCENK